MDDIEKMLKILAEKTMFHIDDDHMDALIKEYQVFMSHVQVLETIDTQDIEPLPFPYEIETTFLRNDEDIHSIKREDALKNAHCVFKDQVKVPKVVES